VTLKRKVINEESFTFWSTGEAGSVSIAQAEGSTDTTTTGTTTGKTTGTTTTTDPVGEEEKQKKSNSFEQQLQVIREAIFNAMSDPDIKALIEPRGYYDAQMQEGLALYNGVEAVYQQQQTALAAKVEATRCPVGLY